MHVIDLLALYRAETGDTSITTVEGFLADDKAMRFAAETMDKFTGYLSRMSVLFNVDGKKKFTPKNRQVFQILQHFYSRMKTVAYADAYNLDFVKLPGFDTVPYWQGFGEASATTGSVDFDEVSAIKVKTADGNTVSQTGIVGFLCDEWAIMHTIISERVAHVRFDPENADEFFYQFRDQRINNLGMPAVVKIDALGGEKYNATITEIGNTGTNNGGSSKYTVELTMDRAGDMLAGMNASATIVLDAVKDVLTIPAAALVENGNHTVVYTGYDEEQEMLLDPVMVQVGCSDGESVEILEGLENGQIYYYAYYDTLEISFTPDFGGGFMFG